MAFFAGVAVIVRWFFVRYGSMCHCFAFFCRLNITVVLLCCRCQSTWKSGCNIKTCGTCKQNVCTKSWETTFRRGRFVCVAAVALINECHVTSDDDLHVYDGTMSWKHALRMQLIFYISYLECVFHGFRSVRSPFSSPIDHSNTAEILLAWLWLRCVVCIASCEAFVPFAQELLVEIRRRRSTFDTLENCREFGPVVVEYAKVQSKVNLKYDSWHKDVLSRFGQLIGQVRHVPLACLKYCCSYAVVVGW